MALSDPLSITIGSAISLPRVKDDGLGSQYWSADRVVRETVASQMTSLRSRTNVRVDKDVSWTDPLTGLPRLNTGSAYVVFDFPLNASFSTADKIAIAAGLFTQLTASSNAMLTKVLQFEH
jgi:hypothetical protein